MNFAYGQVRSPSNFVVRIDGILLAASEQSILTLQLLEMQDPFRCLLFASPLDF